VIARAMIVWAGIAVIAVLNGGFRESVLIPRAGETTGRALSTLMLSAAVLAVTFFTISWIAVDPARDAWRIGALWLGLTLAFEFLAGHYLFRVPWREITADYNVLRGRIWVLVLLVTLVAPAAAAALRGRTP
jgi:hypothetical protein